MRKLFRVEVQKPLTDLVSTNAVARQLLPSRIHVYLSADETSVAQLERRLAIGDKALDVALPVESIRIEILLEVIRAPERTLGEKELGSLLRQRGVLVKDEEVRYVLAYYDIKKNGFCNRQVNWRENQSALFEDEFNAFVSTKAIVAFSR